jgi:hypothetical protein
MRVRSIVAASDRTQSPAVPAGWMRHSRSAYRCGSRGGVRPAVDRDVTGQPRAEPARQRGHDRNGAPPCRADHQLALAPYQPRRDTGPGRLLRPPAGQVRIPVPTSEPASSSARFRSLMRASRRLVQAFPATTNGPSNGICRSVGFRFAGEQDVTFAGRVIRTSHWVINPRADLI